MELRLTIPRHLARLRTTSDICLHLQRPEARRMEELNREDLTPAPPLGPGNEHPHSRNRLALRIQTTGDAIEGIPRVLDTCSSASLRSGDDCPCCKADSLRPVLTICIRIKHGSPPEIGEEVRDIKAPRLHGIGVCAYPQIKVACRGTFPLGSIDAPSYALPDTALQVYFCSILVIASHSLRYVYVESGVVALLGTLRSSSPQLHHDRAWVVCSTLLRGSLSLIICSNMRLASLRGKGRSRLTDLRNPAALLHFPFPHVTMPSLPEALGLPSFDSTIGAVFLGLVVGIMYVRRFSHPSRSLTQPVLGSTV